MEAQQFVVTDVPALAGSGGSKTWSCYISCSLSMRQQPLLLPALHKMLLLQSPLHARQMQLQSQAVV